MAVDAETEALDAVAETLDAMGDSDEGDDGGNDIQADVTPCQAKGCAVRDHGSFCGRHERVLHAIVESLRPSMGSRAVREAMDAMRTMDDPAGAYGVPA